MAVTLDFAHPETLPTRRTEAWRYSDMRAAVRSPLPPSPAPANDATGEGFTAHLGGAEQVWINGRGPSEVGTIEGLHRFRFVSTADGTAHNARVALRIDSDAVLVESYEGQGRGYGSETALAIALAPGASLERIVFADEPDDAVSVSHAEVTLAPGARFRQTVLASGAKLQRVETHVTHPGGGAAVRLDGVYLLADRRHADLTSVVTHMGRDGTTTQLTKGVVRDAARGVFQGRIVVEEGADGTDARMGHHALILSDRAEVDAKPELEIFADDVSCAHGNTVGALDEEALFYAQSRGLPLDAARALLVEAFVGEVVDRIDHEGARDVARAWVSTRLRAADV